MPSVSEMGVEIRRLENPEAVPGADPKWKWEPTKFRDVQHLDVFRTLLDDGNYQTFFLESTSKPNTATWIPNEGEPFCDVAVDTILAVLRKKLAYHLYPTTHFTPAEKRLDVSEAVAS